MSGKVILAIDQGTTGTTALLLTPDLKILAKANTEFKQYYPKPGWVEHDPNEIWKSTLISIEKVLKTSSIDPSSLFSIGITNQRETVCAWDRNTGEILHRAIVWQCRRTSEICRALKEKGLEETVSTKTGLLLDPYFSGTKMKWLLENIESIQKKAKSNSLSFGTIDTFLLNRFTSGESYFTEPSNASRTLLMNLKTGDWDPELLEIFGVSQSALPVIHSSDSHFGKTKGVGVLPDGIPIHGILGDQQAALFGQACFEKGKGKATYGTGSFLLVNTGSEIYHSKNRLLTTVAWKLQNQLTYALEGSAFIAGAAVQWLRDELQIVDSSPESEELALRAPLEEMGELVVVPAFTGLGAPYWNPEARGLISGITRGTGRAHIARATLEAIALQNWELIECMKADGQPFQELRVDGGASLNGLLIQTQSNLLDIDCVRPENIETTALGAAMMAGLGVGVWSGFQDLASSWQESKRFNPDHTLENYTNALKKKWKEAVKKA